MNGSALGAGGRGSEKTRARKERAGGVLKPRLIVLSLLLVVAIFAVAWQARARLHQARTLRRKTLEVAVKAPAPPPLAPAPKPEAPPATNYADVAMKDLFSKDRNPTVVIEVPKAVPPKPMPPLPVVYGVLGLPSGPRAIMAEKSGQPEKPYHAGDKIGEFTILALNTKDITFEWDGKKVERRIEDLTDHSGRGAASAAGNAAAPPPPTSPAVNFFPTPPGQPGTQANNNPPAASLQGSPIGAEIGAAGQSERACRPGDSSPAGAVVDGYRKVAISTPFWNELQMGTCAVRIFYEP